MLPGVFAAGMAALAVIRGIRRFQELRAAAVIVRTPGIAAAAGVTSGLMGERRHDKPGQYRRDNGNDGNNADFIHGKSSLIMDTSKAALVRYHK